MSINTLELAKQLISRRSVSPDDAGCLDILIDLLKPLGFECGPTNATIHKINECIRLDELEQLPKIYLQTLKNLLIKRKA